MAILIVLENPRNWNLDVPGAEVVGAREYLTNPRYSERRRDKVYNLCRTYGYQSLGYYVSLLAAARGHRPLPSVRTLQDLRQAPVLRIVAEGVDDLIQQSLSSLKSDRFELSVYFGRNVARRYDRLSNALFNHFPAPMLRADFVREDRWRLKGVRPIATGEIPAGHRDFLIEQAARHFARPGRRALRRFRYDLAILVDPEEIDAPSDETAIRKFVRAARAVNLQASVIEKDELGRLGEYDGLFIRATTYVNHFTYRFSARADAEGLAVIDDPLSILRCTNKVFLAESFERAGIPSPRTLIVHRDNTKEIGERLGFPVVLKRPDSSFSRGVVKAHDPGELETHLKAFFDESELVVAQEYTPSSFDWRVGVLEGKPLFVCRYHMAKGHWQIQKSEGSARVYGKVDTLSVEDAPSGVVDVGVRAAGLIGNGLYGVDLKEVDGRLLVMEVNDNPSIESGVEDKVLKDELYRAIMRSFYRRLENRGRGR